MANYQKKDSLTKKIVISAMILAFIIGASTGILKFRELLRPFNIPYDKLPMQQISVWHDWANFIFVFLIFIHLFLQRFWFAYQFSKNKNSKKLLLIVIILILIVVGSFFIKPSNIQQLKNVEVKQYQGQNLSSISDFRENSIKGPQFIDIKNYKLSVVGLVDKNLSLNYDQVLNHNKYSKVVTLNCVEGWSVKILWEGVLLKDLLNEAGIKQGSNTIIFYSQDGYSSSLPLDYIVNNNIILAYKMNGVNIPPERGFPFMLVAEDKWGYKWVKWITKIEVSSDTNFKGYWEKAGYNQKGDLNGPMFQN